MTVYCLIQFLLDKVIDTLGVRSKEEEISVFFRKFCTSFNPHYTIVILITKADISDFISEVRDIILNIII